MVPIPMALPRRPYLLGLLPGTSNDCTEPTEKERGRENERNYESMQQVMCYTNKVGYKHLLERQSSKHEQEEKSCHEHNRVAT